MSSKVVSLKGDAVPVGSQPNGDVVETLKTLLAQAESGELVGFACGFEEANTNMSFHVVGTIHNLAMLGIIELIKHDIIASMDD